MKKTPLYIETLIRCDMQPLWEHTQQPELHQLWDLRFTEIHYLTRENASEPQHFLYKTKIGFGLEISGTGETVAGKTNGSGKYTSALKFGSGSRLSLIRTGSGYWKYSPVPSGIRFITGYDYETRWGWPGAALDKWIFRPLMAWATAWRFDRLRNWLEKGIHPRAAVVSQLTVVCCQLLLAFVWIYQGLVPKLLFPGSGELALTSKTGIFQGHELLAVQTIGFLEIGFGIFLLFFASRWMHFMSMAGVFALSLAGFLAWPEVLTQPFNPLVITLSLVAISMIALLNLPLIPSAKNCIKKP